MSSSSDDDIKTCNPICGGCGEDTTDAIGLVREAIGRKWHENCWKCKACTLPLYAPHLGKDGSFFTWEDKPYCEKCYRKKCNQ